MPAAISGQRRASGTPDETTPQAKAHIGGNQVIGFSNSTTADGAGYDKALDDAAEVMARCCT